MGIVRNSINIEGIIAEEDIPNKIKGQMIRYSEIETLYVPYEKPEIKNIYEISINIEIKSKRTVHTPFGKIIIVDGIKEYKIMYTENTELDTVNILYFRNPYNTFIELPEGIQDILDIQINVLDAYFDVIDSRKIYGHFVYLVDVDYDKKDIRNNLIKSEEILLDRNSTLNKMENFDFTMEDISITEEKVISKDEELFIDIEEEIL